MTTDRDPYLHDPAKATHVRVFDEGFSWAIDAADDEGHYTEVVWTFGPPAGRPEDEWEKLVTKEAALATVPLFVAEVVPHLAGTEPRVV